MNQASSIDEIFDSRKNHNANIDLNKLEKIYSESSRENNANSAMHSNDESSNFKQIENLMNQHFNYSHVYNNIEHGKKDVDPFSFVDDMLKPKKN